MIKPLDLMKGFISCTIALGLSGLPANSFDDRLGDVPDRTKSRFSSARLDRIKAWYEARIEAGEISGSVVALAIDGQLAYSQASGFQDRSKTVAMRSNSIFWIASMTKPITSVAALILVDDGKLELDAPVAKYLPELANMKVGIVKSGNILGSAELPLESARRPITVRDLLRHTSGLLYPPRSAEMSINALYAKAEFQEDRTLAHFVASLAGLPLGHQPGEVWEYSYSTDVLARIVEVASGKPFDAFLQARIFDPLNMIDTSFHVDQSKLHRLVDPPTRRIPQFDITRPRKLLSGGAGLASTAVDYMIFCQMLLNGGVLNGNRVLTDESVRRLTQNSLPDGVRFIGVDTGPKVGASWGLGVNVRVNANTSIVPGSVGSYGWSGIWGTYFWVDPAEKLIAIQMIQVTPDKVGPYYSAIRNLTYGALSIDEVTSPSKLTSPIEANTLFEYGGRYDFGPSSSARDRMEIGVSDFVGIGVEIETVRDGIKVKKLSEFGSAADAGVKPGDVFIEIDRERAAGLRIGQALGKLRGMPNSIVALKVSRPGIDTLLDLTVKRVPIHVPLVELTVRVKNGRLDVEASGPWPILEFERGGSIAASANGRDLFSAESRDRTQIVFQRNVEGKISGMILNPGPQQAVGVRLSDR